MAGLHVSWNCSVDGRSAVVALQGRGEAQEELCSRPWGVWSDGERVQISLSPVAAGVSGLGVCLCAGKCLLLCRAGSDSD